jgi:hypothetical protein
MTTKKDHDIPAKVYKELADQIKSLTSEVDYSEGECEIQKNGLTYWVKYTVQNEQRTIYPADYDSQPDMTTFSYCWITDWNVKDINGDLVNVTMDGTEVENYFDMRPSYDDKD